MSVAIVMKLKDASPNEMMAQIWWGPLSNMCQCSQWYRRDYFDHVTMSTARAIRP